MNKKYNKIRGFRDILGSLYEEMTFIKDTAKKTVKSYGYKGIDIPILESTEVFERLLGDTSEIVNKEMYTFLDRNNESLTLRPEGTAGVMRAFIENGLTQSLPQKFFYEGPMFRYDRPQKGRFRQFYQFGIECIGVDSPYIDYETIEIANNIIKNLGITGHQLYINTIGDIESRKKYNGILLDYFSKFRLSETSQKALLTNPIRILDSKDPTDIKICKNAPKFILNEKSQKIFDIVCNFLTKNNIAFKKDNALVRGLDYYCHTVFEFRNDQLLGAQNSFLGGGRFDGLSEIMGGPNIPSIGFAFGIDRLAIMLENQKIKQSNPIVVIPFEENMLQYAMLVASKIREKNNICEISFKGKLSKDLKYAQNCGAKIAILIGSDELKNQKITIKYLNSENPNKTIDIKDF